MKKLFCSKKNISLTIIGVTIISLVAFAITFAFLRPEETSPAKTPVMLTHENIDWIKFDPGTNLSVSPGSHNLATGMDSLTSTSNPTATLTNKAGNGELIETTYHVYLEVPTNTFIYSSGNTPEMILQIFDENNNEITNNSELKYVTTVDSNGVTHKGFDITNFSSADLIPIKENIEISTTNETVHTYTFTIKFLNINADQSSNANASLDANIVMQSDIKERNYASDYIINLHSGVDGMNGIYYTNNAEYRFTGANPNNYVTFNDELWRIIGVFDENSHGQTGEQLVKLIKEETLGNYEYDPSNDNSWSDADGGAELKQILNEAYYNSEVAANLLADCGNTSRGSCDFTTRGLSAEARSMVEEVTWYLGGESSTYSTALEHYIAERGSTTSNGTDLDWVGKIGLMYPSDYGYAAYKEAWTTDMSENFGLDYSQVEITSNNWMYAGDVHSTEKTITPLSSRSSNVFSIIYHGNMDGDFAYSGNASRPALYLNSSVEITGGTGSEADPFTLS